MSKIEINKPRDFTRLTQEMGEQIEIESEVNLRILEVVSRLKQEVDGMYEELEMLMNKKMVENVERSRKEMQEGELYDWDDFLCLK